ncbi:hypothetical protein PTKU64_80650 [Paraburkholderia terrae]|uniref:Uncharacterized protein n=1 Tax=Paraburkholderia terrae TaxID=311230 RepID=A0ABN6JVG5_9BURK|nr:hypothetical protein PTKU64_80650 [Paraburkholderia terrae]BDC45647.1 hypothetical protein PTKU15_89440 [Paraburkholderia terrae]
MHYKRQILHDKYDHPVAGLLETQLPTPDVRVGCDTNLVQDATRSLTVIVCVAALLNPD